MQLTLHTDYALRALLYAALYPDRRVTTREVSEAYQISNHHLVKVVRSLAQHGFIKTTAGRGGGFQLGPSPEAITIGAVVEALESFELVECMGSGGACAIQPGCALKGVLSEAQAAFMAVLYEKRLSDLIGGREPLMRGLLQASATSG